MTDISSKNQNMKEGSGNMTIILKKNDHYVAMSNYHLIDKRLSLKAKGLLSVILNFPNNWEFSVKGLIAICKEGRDSVRATLDELKQYGYITIRRIDPNADNNRITWEYIVCGNPEEMQEITLSLAAAAGCAGVTASSAAGLIFMLIYDFLHRENYTVLRHGLRRSEPLTSAEIITELASVALPAALCALVTNITSMIDLATVMNSLKTAASKDPRVFAEYDLTPESIPNFFYGSFSGLALTVFNLVPSVTNMFGRSIMPSAAAAHASGDRKELGKCALDVVMMTAFAAVPCGIGISVLARPILSMLFSGSPAEVSAAWRPLAVMGAGMIMGASYYMGLPKDKKKDIKDKAMKMLEADENFMSSMS